LFHENVRLDGSHGDAQVTLQPGEQLIPEGSLFGCLDLRQVQDDTGSTFPKLLVVVDDVQAHVDDRGGKTRAIVRLNVTIIQVQSTCAKDLRGEV